MFFYGEFPYSMDDRKRVPIPPPFRPEFEQKGIVMTRGNEHCVTVYTTESFNAEVAAMRELSRANGSVRNAMRHVFGKMRQQDRPDGQGRVTLDPQLIEWAGLKTEVIVVGADTVLEIWDRAAWEAGAEQREAGYEQVLDAVSGLQNQRLGLVGIGSAGGAS
jgi:MraZ protein